MSSNNSLSSSTLPLLTICIPTFNRPHLLRACLQSLKDIQLDKVLNYKLHISDNSQNKDSEIVCNEFTSFLDFSYQRNKENKGGGANVISFFKNCETKYLHVASDKTIFNHNYIDIISILIAQDTKAAFLNYQTIGELNNIKEPGESVSLNKYSFEEGLVKLSYKITNLSSLFFNMENFSIEHCKTDYIHSSIPQTHFFLLISKFNNDLTIVDTSSISIGGNKEVKYDLFAVFYSEFLELFSFYDSDLRFSSRLKFLFSHCYWLSSTLLRIRGESQFKIFTKDFLKNIPRKRKLYFLFMGLVNDFSKLLTI